MKIEMAIPTENKKVAKEAIRRIFKGVEAAWTYGDNVVIKLTNINTTVVGLAIEEDAYTADGIQLYINGKRYNFFPWYMLNELGDAVAEQLGY